jgi:hypothetical protein
LAIVSDLPVNVFKPFGIGKGSAGTGKGSALFSLSPEMIHAVVLGLKDDMKAGTMDVVYMAYTVGQYEYESDCPAEETVVKETVNKIVLIETYPFLWTILVLFWNCSVGSDREAGPIGASVLIPDAVLEVYLCVRRDVGRFKSVMDRENRIPINVVSPLAERPCRVIFPSRLPESPEI